MFSVENHYHYTTITINHYIKVERNLENLVMGMCGNHNHYHYIEVERNLENLICLDCRRSFSIFAYFYLVYFPPCTLVTLLSPKISNQNTEKPGFDKRVTYRLTDGHTLL